LWLSNLTTALRQLDPSAAASEKNLRAAKPAENASRRRRRLYYGM